MLQALADDLANPPTLLGSPSPFRFRPLTHTHNRFSLDKRLDDLIGEARQSSGLFALSRL